MEQELQLLITEFKNAAEQIGTPAFEAAIGYIVITGIRDLAIGAFLLVLLLLLLYGIVKFIRYAREDGQPDAVPAIVVFGAIPGMFLIGGTFHHLFGDAWLRVFVPAGYLVTKALGIQ